MLVHCSVLIVVCIMLLEYRVVLVEYNVLDHTCTCDVPVPVVERNNERVNDRNNE